VHVKFVLSAAKGAAQGTLDSVAINPQNENMSACALAFGIWRVGSRP
jgi:hypothetical protein